MEVRVKESSSSKSDIERMREEWEMIDRRTADRERSKRKVRGRKR